MRLARDYPEDWEARADAMLDNADRLRDEAQEHPDKPTPHHEGPSVTHEPAISRAADRHNSRSESGNLDASVSSEGEAGRGVPVLRGLWEGSPLQEWLTSRRNRRRQSEHR